MRMTVSPLTGATLSGSARQLTVNSGPSGTRTRAVPKVVVICPLMTCPLKPSSWTSLMAFLLSGNSFESPMEIYRVPKKQQKKRNDTRYPNPV